MSSAALTVNQDENIPIAEKQVQHFLKHMLQGRLFIGSFQEKRHVEILNAYRDVVMVSKDEHDLIHDLEIVRKRAQEYYPFDHWIGITTPEVIGAPAGHCLWVELDVEVFDSYWYKIKSVRFRSKEILLKLKAIRKVSSTNNITTELKRTTKTSGQNNIDLNVIKTYITKQLTYCFANIFTLHNTKEIIVFVSLLLATIATGSVQIAKYIAEYFLKFLHETSNFVKATTPVMISCINLLSKIIGGFYLLIATLWRDRNISVSPQYRYIYNQQQPMLVYHEDYTSKRALPAPPKRHNRSSVVITPLD